MYVDSHAHLSLPGPFDADRDEVLRRATIAGVTEILDLATRPEEVAGAMAFAAAHPGVVAAAGVHPHEATRWSPEAKEELRRHAGHPCLAAIGEIGLDYHYRLAPPEVQRRAFAEQLQLASELQLPVSIHSREAEDDTLAILRDSDVRTLGGAMHCFTGSENMARECLALGLHLSFSGIITFRNAERLRHVAAAVPEDRLLVETDAPYLAPVPHRGGRNEPAFVVAVLQRVAEVRGTAPETLAGAVRRSFRSLFRHRDTGSGDRQTGTTR